MAACGHGPLELHALSGWMRVSRRHSPAFVAGNDAPLIGERPATRGRSATEGGDARAGLKMRYPSSSSSRPTEARWHIRLVVAAVAPPTLQPQRPRRATRPGARTLARYPSAVVAGHDAPLIDERAAARGSKGLGNPFEFQPREPDRTAGTLTHWPAKSCSGSGGSDLLERSEEFECGRALVVSKPRCCGRLVSISERIQILPTVSAFCERLAAAFDLLFGD
jgi:hypothetical protein